MPLRQDEILSVCQQLAEEENLKVCVTESLKGACIAGGCALVGSLLMGPPGLAIGGIVGSVTAAVKGKGKYKSVAEVIMCDMTPAQRQRLAASVRRAVEDVRPEEVAVFAAMIMTNASLKQLVLMELTKFLKNEMNLPIA